MKSGRRLSVDGIERARVGGRIEEGEIAEVMAGSIIFTRDRLDIQER